MGVPVFAKGNSEFQSAPDREAGRCSGPFLVMNTQRSFQSAPDREAGRCDIEPVALTGLGQFQSAPDREAGRCTPHTRPTPSGSGFNPRPTVRPGDAQWNAAQLVKKLVSIRARP